MARCLRHIQTACLCVLTLLSSVLLARADTDALDTAIQQLPVSIGSNHQIIMPTDDWTQVGISEHIGFSHLHWANPGGFRAGQTVLIPGQRLPERWVPDGVVLNLPELMLYYWRNGEVAAYYPISIGRITERWNTPVGALHVVSKLVDPVWRSPDWAGLGDVPPGPKNPLGNRWLGLNREGYGIHGTNEPTSIGRTVSHGCIRMFPQHILQLFDDAWINMPVIITYQTVALARSNGVIYMAVFPDAYSMGTNELANAQLRLAGFGLSGILSDEELSRRLARDDGVARPILGSPITLTIDGKPCVLPIGPTVWHGQAYVPLRRLATRLGASVMWDEAKQMAITKYGAKSYAVPAPGQHTFHALGCTFAPLRPMIEALGGKVEYSNATIHITLPKFE